LNSSELSLRKRVDMEEPIQHVRVNWLSGEIRVVPSEDGHMHVFHYADARFSERKLMQWDVSEGTMSITDGRKKGSLFGLNVGRTALEIRVPNKTLASLWISTVGGKLWVDDVHTTRCYCNITSGRADISGVTKELELSATASSVNGQHLKADRLDLKTGSTKIRFSGEFQNVHSKSTGRGVSLECLTTPEHLHVVSTGEKVSVSIPFDNEGFKVHLEKRSGALKSDFMLSPCNGSNKHFMYKGGKNDFKIDIRGGRFHLKSHRP